MAGNKKITQLPALGTLLDTGLFEFSALNSGVWTSFRITLLQVVNYVLANVTPGWMKNTYSASTNTWVNIGSSVNYGAVRVVYMATQGSSRVTGQFDVVHDGTNAKVSDGPKTSIPSKLDLEIKESQLNAGQIQVKISVGSTGDVDLVYRLDQKPINL